MCIGRFILGIYSRLDMEIWNIVVVFIYIYLFILKFSCDVLICILDRVVDSLFVLEMEIMYVDENFKGYFIIKY